VILTKRPNAVAYRALDADRERRCLGAIIVHGVEEDLEVAGAFAVVGEAGHYCVRDTASISGSSSSCSFFERLR
jgi:hypothetical protein